MMKLINIEMINKQQITINKIVTFIKNNNYFGEDYHNYKDNQDKNNLFWKNTFYGDKFLRHIERCKVLIHLIDISEKDIIGNYLKIRNELSKYDKSILKKKEIVIFNKSDLEETFFVLFLPTFFNLGGAISSTIFFLILFLNPFLLFFYLFF